VTSTAMAIGRRGAISIAMIGRVAIDRAATGRSAANRGMIGGVTSRVMTVRGFRAIAKNGRTASGRGRIVLAPTA
jgi:hypothetical protein